MGAFSYSALNNNGKNKKGVIQADSEKNVRIQLRAQGLIPLSIHPVNEASVAHQSKWTLFRPKLSTAELALITRQLATMISAGLPLEEVLASVSEQAEKPNQKNMLMAIRSKILEGHTLASALGDFPSIFDKLYCATVAAGEKTGHLDIVLDRLASFTERRHEVRQKVSSALIYPSIIIFASISIVGFLLIYVVPKMVSVFTQNGQILPLATRILLALSDSLQSIGLYGLITLILGALWFKRSLKNIAFKTKVDQLILKLPFFGKTIRLINTARFAHTLAILTEAGVDIIESMRISTEIVENIPIKKSLEVATKQIREGISIHRALKETHFFPPMSIYLISSGEASGQLEPMLERVALNQEKQVEQSINIIMSLFEPLMILVMGGIVLFIVLAILLPIFDLDQFVQ